MSEELFCYVPCSRAAAWEAVGWQILSGPLQLKPPPGLGGSRRAVLMMIVEWKQAWDPVELPGGYSIRVWRGTQCAMTAATMCFMADIVELRNAAQNLRLWAREIRHENTPVPYAGAEDDLAALERVAALLDDDAADEIIRLKTSFSKV